MTRSSCTATNIFCITQHHQCLNQGSTKPFQVAYIMHHDPPTRSDQPVNMHATVNPPIFKYNLRTKGNNQSINLRTNRHWDCQYWSIGHNAPQDRTVGAIFRKRRSLHDWMAASTISQSSNCPAIKLGTQPRLLFACRTIRRITHTLTLAFVCCK